MKSLARDVFGFVWLYIVGAASALGWMVWGMYVYMRPVVSDTPFTSDFNHDIGTALVAQGLIFFVTFTFAGVIRSFTGNKEQKEQKKDRQMLREIYQWMQEQRKAEANPRSSGLPVSSGNGVKPEGEATHVN